MPGFIPTQTLVFSPIVTGIGSTETTLWWTSTVGNTALPAKVVETVTSSGFGAAGVSVVEYLSLVTSIASPSASPSAQSSSTSQAPSTGAPSSASASIHAAAVSPSPEATAAPGDNGATLRAALLGTLIPLAVIAVALAWLLIRRHRRRRGIESRARSSDEQIRRRRNHHSQYTQLQQKAWRSSLWESVRRGTDKERSFLGYDDEKEAVKNEDQAVELPA